MTRPAVAVVLVGLVVVGLAAPVLAVAPGDGEPATSSLTASTAAAATQSPSSNASVNVTVGQQLSTVIGVSSDEVQTDVENTAFELSVADARDETRAAAIADRAAELRDRAEEIREDYAAASDAYEDGDLTRSEYAQRLAALNARASNLLDSYEQLRQRAATVSTLELRAAGLDQAALNRSVENLSAVTGTGTRALLKQFTGEAEGDIELETANGLFIAVESEDGERSREFERPRDATDTLTVRQAAALETARGVLSPPDAGRWVLTDAAVDADDGAYTFAFALRNATTLTGEAEIAVDGSTGTVFALEEEIETRDDEDGEDVDEADDDRETDSDHELALVIVEGSPSPSETVTVQVLANGAPVENVPVSLNDRAVGTTDADGRVTVTLPAGGEADLTARTDDAEGELEFEFEDEADDDEVYRNLAVDAMLDGDTVMTTVRYDGQPVENAGVYANGRSVGTTDSDGTVTFTINAAATEELELDVVKGAFEAELVFRVDDGSLTLTEAAHEGDDEMTDDADDSEEDETETPEPTETPEDDEDDAEETETDSPEDDEDAETED